MSPREGTSLLCLVDIKRCHELNPSAAGLAQVSFAFDMPLSADG